MKSKILVVLKKYRLQFLAGFISVLLVISITTFIALDIKNEDSKNKSKDQNKDTSLSFPDNNTSYPQDTTSYPSDNNSVTSDKSIYFYTKSTTNTDKYIYQKLDLKTFTISEISNNLTVPKYVSKDAKFYATRTYLGETTDFGQYGPTKFTFFDNKNQELSSYTTTSGYCAEGYWSKNNQYFIIDCYYGGGGGHERIIFDVLSKKKLHSIYGFQEKALFTEDNKSLIYIKYSSGLDDPMSNRIVLSGRAMSIYKLDLETKKETVLMEATMLEDYAPFYIDPDAPRIFYMEDNLIYFAKHSVPVSYIKIEGDRNNPWFNAKLTYWSMDLNGKNLTQLSTSSVAEYTQVQTIIRPYIGCEYCRTITKIEDNLFLVVYQEDGAGLDDTSIALINTKSGKIEKAFKGNLLYID